MEFEGCNSKSVGLKIKNQSEWKFKIRRDRNIKSIWLKVQKLSD